MSDVAFRSSSPTPQIVTHTESVPEPKKNEVGAQEDFGDLEPIDSDQSDGVILSAIGIDDSPRNLPESDKSNLHEMKSYVLDLLNSKGITPTLGAYKRMIGEIREKMDIDPDTEPSVLLDRIGGVVKSWKSIAFITDPKERRSVFMRLARQPDSKSMDRTIYEEMEKRRVWQ